MKSQLDQMSLFSAGNKTSSKSTKKPLAPLAHRARPSSFSKFIGQDHIWSEYPFLKSKAIPSLIIWGPPGTGKTTLANLIAKESEYHLYHFNAVLGGISDLRKLIGRAKDVENFHNTKSIIFIDEIHRFNKSQQDGLLPYVEKGDFILIGATTENPQQSINRALLSRTQQVKLVALQDEDIVTILSNVAADISLIIPKSTTNLIAQFSAGDVRQAINTLEALESELKDSSEDKQQELVKTFFQQKGRWYDHNGQRHYDVVSAFIKSMRANRPDDALLWLAVMLDGGEDPRFIARRLSIFAAEDVGNADPMATILASSTLTSVEKLGMPEARINLAQTTSYLASTVKSTAAYQAINLALEYVQNNPVVEVPAQLRNVKDSPRDAKELKVPSFYNPKDVGMEKRFKERLEKIKKS